MNDDLNRHKLPPSSRPEEPDDWNNNDDDEFPEEELDELEADLIRRFPLHEDEDDEDDLPEEELDEQPEFKRPPHRRPAAESWGDDELEALDELDELEDLTEMEELAELDEDEDELWDEDVEEAGPDSTALIERFLEETSGTPGTDWHDEPLPAGHRSGFVAVIGRPNVGKSTLVNALMEQKVAIVSDKPQTTRRRIAAILTQPEYQLIFIDTPGIHKSPYQRLGAAMIESATSAIPDADVILFVVDISAPPREEDQRIAALLRQKAGKRPVFFVMNKMDALSLEQAKERIEAYWTLLPTYTDSIPTSALHDRNIDLLREHLLKHIPEGPRYYPTDQITDQTEREIAAELIREATLRYTHQEVPHATAVLIEEFKERPNGDTYISATIWVERDSQKPIIIGKQGQMLKRIGATARQELERFIGGHVYLELWVKVRPNWRDREQDLQELGLK